MRETIIKEVGKEVFNYLSEHVKVVDKESLVIFTSSVFNIENQEYNKYNNIINLRRINDIIRINKFFEAVNVKIPNNGLFIGHVETKNQRKERYFRKFPTLINHFLYFLDFIIKRIFPKFLLTKRIYFYVTGGRNRVITRTETLGRLFSCGFEVVNEKVINNHLYFVAKKVKEPVFDNNPTYGPLVRLKRVAKGGKIINVYKMRTMHPYAEYLQGYLFDTNNLKPGGKFKDDYRVSTIGKIMRKFWIDELPMLINLLKGNMKLVGVRPLSKHYFSLYTKELQERRIKYKPGLVPPFYVDLPETLDQIMESEIRYLDAYEKHPFLTDVKYFFAAFYNIVIKRARSN